MFNDAELALIKSMFSGDGEDFLYLIRNALLQFPLTKEERARLKGVMSSEVYRVVKKKILPSIDHDAPLGQLADLWQSLNNDLKAKDLESMIPLFKAKRLEIEYLEQQFEFLMDVERDFVPKIVLENLSFIVDEETPEEWFVNTTARNFLLAYVDSFLIQLKMLAGQKVETVEETKKRLIRDSSK